VNLDGLYGTYHFKEAERITNLETNRSKSRKNLAIGVIVVVLIAILGLLYWIHRTAG